MTTHKPGCPVELMKTSPLYVEPTCTCAQGTEPKFHKGEIVAKTTGDYTAKGVVLDAIKKLSGARRYVVEVTEARGLIYIFNEGQLSKVTEPQGTARERLARFLRQQHFGLNPEEASRLWDLPGEHADRDHWRRKADAILQAFPGLRGCVKEKKR